MMVVEQIKLHGIKGRNIMFPLIEYIHNEVNSSKVKDLMVNLVPCNL